MQNKEQSILSGSRNIFLTGVAGTGKTYQLNKYIKEHSKTLVAASTGTAAVNLGASTLHKLCSVPVPAYGANPAKVTPSQLKIFADIDTIIIDEISMCRCDVFSFAVRVIKRAEKLYGKKIRIIASGDFSQLPPVVKKSDESYLTRYGFDKSGFAFTTKEWAELKFKTICLTEMKRQTEKEFIENLSLARIGDDKCIPYFNEFVRPIPDDGIRLCGTNAEADRINTEYLNSINALSIAYVAEKSGITGKELPCDEIVLLKEGARVIFTANDQMIDADGKFNPEFGENGRYQNGTFGKVNKVYPDHVLIRLADDSIINVKPYKWSIYNYTVDRSSMQLKKKEIGYIKQIPLKVAKAITIHKSQGKQFDKMVLSPQIFTSGQLYVALSRVTGPEGLYLTEPVLPEYLQVDKTVKKFYESNFTFEVSQARIDKQKNIEKKQSKKPRKRRKTTTKKKAVVKKNYCKKK